MPIKKVTILSSERQSPQSVKKKTTGKRVGKSKQEKANNQLNRRGKITDVEDHAVFGYQATPFDDGRLRLFSIPGNAFSSAQRIKRLIIHLTGIVVVYEK